MLPARPTSQPAPPDLDTLVTEASFLDRAPIRLPITAFTLDGFGEWLHSENNPEHVRASFLGSKITLDFGVAGRMVSIPLSAATPRGFRKWAKTDRFPERGRISYLDDEILLDMSPDEIETHNKVKTEIVSALQQIVRGGKLGELLSDGAELTNEAARLDTVPDGVFVTWATSAARRVRMVPRRDEYGEYVEVDGSPDWVLEVVSRSSVEKDTKTLRRLYHRAGIGEYWLVNARGPEIRFQILVRGRARYAAVKPSGGWHRSPVFGRSSRLEREINPAGRWSYVLHTRPA